MRKLYLLAICLLTACLAFTVSATTFIVDGQTANVTGTFNYNRSTDTLEVFTDVGGYTLAPSDGGPVDPPPDPTVQEVTLRVDTLDVGSIEAVIGEPITFSWTATLVNNCQFRRGEGTDWASGTPTTPTGERVMTVTWLDPVRFRLYCLDVDTGAVVDDSVLVIPVEAAPEPPPVGADACTKSDAEIPLKRTGVTYAVSWNEAYNPEFWPLPIQTKYRMQIPRNYYASLYFDTGNVLDTGGLSPITISSADGPKLISISPCEGDFDVLTSCRAIVGDSGGLLWSTSGNTLACPLDPDTRYYVNLTFTDGVTPLGDCGDCLIDLQANNPIPND